MQNVKESPLNNQKFKSFYGLIENPFDKEATASPFESEDFIQIRERSKWLMNSRGLGVFTGKAGTGKTYAIRQFVKEFNNRNYKFYYVHSTSLTNIEFYRALCYEFNIESSHRRVTMFKKIRDYITTSFKDNKISPVLIIDEAHFLNQNILNDLSLLLNYEYDSRNYLTILMLGMETLNSTLALYANEGLRQRITVNYMMAGLSLEEFKMYVNESLIKVGSTGSIFEEAVINTIYNYSRGQIRIANRYLTVCLIAGASRFEKVITTETLKIAYADINNS
ncbi:MAG: AAA family ATPase [Acholeplasmatales bacterium]|jgi:type II secretory pathway predicted ATPase ExeA|nr:AAA family ATPase [Acholeplasmatales bacterium]